MFTNPFDASPIPSASQSIMAVGPHDSSCLDHHISQPSTMTNGPPSIRTGAKTSNPRCLSLTIPPIPRTTDHGRRLSTISTPLREHAPTTPHEWEPPTPGPYSPNRRAMAPPHSILRNSKPHNDAYYATLPKRESAPERSIAINLPSSHVHNTTARSRSCSLPEGLVRTQAELSPDSLHFDLNNIDIRSRRYSLANGPPVHDDYFHHMAGSPGSLTSAPDTPEEHVDSPFPSPPINADDSHAGVNREGRWVSLPSLAGGLKPQVPARSTTTTVVKTSVRFQSFRYRGVGSGSSFLEGRRHSVAVASSVHVDTPIPSPVSRTASGIVA